MKEKNEVQKRITQLEDKGWTLASIGRELDVTEDAVGKWKRDERHPRTEKLVLDALVQLMKKKPPKKKLYAKGSRRQEVTNNDH